MGASKSRKPGPIEAAQSHTIAAFRKQLQSELKNVLGATGLKRVRTDVVITTAAGDGVVMHAPLRQAGRFDRARIGWKSEIVAVLVNTAPLVDPVSLKVLEPGAYAWAIRRVGRDTFAFDFFNERGAPVLSTVARQKDDAGAGSGDEWTIDVDVTWGGGDSLVPPGMMYLCLSFNEWKSCWFLNIPKLPWPF